ncbi:MAG TPA: hypothetical protein VK002_10175 [Rubricoccaceae bacterium]|nr:hypothetical protein [Rubricoccaceae bacterium]
MGQQQLLLLVIAVVLVGLAVVAGFEILQKGYRQDEADGLLDRSLAIATHAVYWKTKNDPFAGGSQSYEELAEGGLGLLGLDSTTVRGRFAITAATDTTLEVTGVSTRPGFEDIGVRVYVNDYDVDSSAVRFDGSFTFD